MTGRSAILVGIALMTLIACSSQQRPATSIPSASSNARLADCASSRLAFSLDSGNGRFNGMSHSGTALVLRNKGASDCVIAAQPLLTFADANGLVLDFAAQSTPASQPPSAAITLAPDTAVSSDLRWVSADVYESGHCESPATVALAVGSHTVSARFTGRLCGAARQPAFYTLTSFKTFATATPGTAGAKTWTYACADGRTVVAAYPDTDSAVLTFNGQTRRMHSAIAADGARYVDQHWQWWTKGMHQGRLAPLKPGESVAAATGTTCTTP